MSEETHHHGQIPLIQLSIGMVSIFPLDYMHLACLGVMRRLLKLWIKGPLKTRQGPQAIRGISASLLALRMNIPLEFARKPRALRDLERWKATEFRQFLLYTGPVVLRHCIPSKLYKNFMLFSIGMFIFLSPTCCKTLTQYGHDLLVRFVEQIAVLYGRDMVTYNVHCLVHLSEDVQKFGSLDKVSCFPFENFLGQLKKMVRKPASPIQQVVRRLSEQGETLQCASGQILQQPHHNGPLPSNMVVREQFSMANLSHFTVKLSEGDNCFQIGNDVALVRNIFVSNGEPYVLFQKFSIVEAFYQSPLDSTVLGIFRSKKMSQKLKVAKLNDILWKYVSIPEKKMTTLSCHYCTQSNCANFHLLHLFPFSIMPTFLIVEFPGEEDVGIISLSWTIGKDKCNWPPFKGSQRFEKAVKLNEKPDSSWSTHRIRILGRAGKRCSNMIHPAQIC
ncbi:hypothetical protein HOLleu_03208 [Holothuria leucospilota]|uniref:Uncharacterized protein n=1 Tax=Holothuria leucospilota TaxID=206669 RepID=A0A9Q1HL86_HOLLE|nr:hypothetical protein HOLleu_03208 [Holothuria leucospilota]